MIDMRCVALSISGRVQGVGYRFWMVGEARARGLAGWVRNRRDGTVEAWAQGPAVKVAALIEACQRGPSGAWVEAIDIRDESAEASLSGFERRPTA